ncbi:expressed unknown protein [Seminavis robusta]|uniref:Uncharacterized protein n=1 Tax=Seminavis robusta TaxID=568900 RepID=A0A9N8EG67_9STRA|nr:expressed unknown protein [Seminavis robusta]|eukprot:Sro1032_g233540.1 n/a (99) ;mRNA; f:17643-17939
MDEAKPWTSSGNQLANLGKENYPNDDGEDKRDKKVQIPSTLAAEGTDHLGRFYGGRGNINSTLVGSHSKKTTYDGIGGKATNDARRPPVAMTRKTRTR